MTKSGKRKQTRAVVLGGAPCVFQDWADYVSGFGCPDLLIIINDLSTHWTLPVPDILCTLHPEKLPDWLRDRANRGLAPIERVFAFCPTDSYVTDTLPYQMPGVSGSGSSGLYACKVAMHMEMDQTVLCGVPMSAKVGHHNNRAKPWYAADKFFRQWRDAEPILKGRVVSMSGRTRELLGSP